MAALSGLRLLLLATMSAALGCLWISALLWRADLGILLVYAPVLLWSVWVFVVALRGGLLRGITLAAVSVMSAFAGGFVAGWIWIFSVELGP